MKLDADVFLDVDQVTVFAAVYRDEEQVGISELGKLEAPIGDDEFDPTPWRDKCQGLLSGAAAVVGSPPPGPARSHVAALGDPS